MKHKEEADGRTRECLCPEQSDKPEHLLCGIAHILRSIFLFHCLRQRLNIAEDREESVYAVGIAQDSVLGHAAGECYDRNVIFFGDGGYADGCFSHNALSVQLPLAGYNQVCVLYFVLQTGFFQNDFDTWFQDGI